jgi:glycosyltransferase involved in cell wall biosynthesis
MIDSPLLSVILPVYNAAGFIVPALESIIAQNGINLEIITVNDGSTDDSREILLHWGRDKSNFRLIDQINSGPGQARNSGIAVAQGHFIAFLDADDLWPPDSLKTRLQVFDKGNSDAVLGLTQAFTSTDKTGLEVNFEGSAFRFLNVGAGLFKRESFERNGIFSPTMSGSEDVDWFLRARDNGLKLKAIETVTLWHRRHENNLTRGQSLSNLDFHLALKRSLDRRRAIQMMETIAPFEDDLSK